MNYNNDIDYIRGLLDKYYQAETLPEDEEILERFFSEVNADEIPEDLASEHKMFSLMRNLHPGNEESMVPDYLKEKLNAIVGKPPLAQNRKKKFHNILLYCGGSVAACILVSFFIVFMQQHKDDTSKVMYVADTHKITEPPVLENEESAATEVSAVEHKVPNVSTIENNESGVDIPSETYEDVEEDGFIEITDPEEAREILQKIGMLLAQNAQETNEALTNISTSIDSYKEISKSILQ